jgi:murein DD-endopeptidase MepM/ murein hydrolase activator NlpD
MLALLLALGPVLEVPWSCGETYSCTQGNGGQASHTGPARYAWDFGMPLGTDVLAAHGGTVLLIEMDSQVGGCSNVYAQDANYVLIDHHDGTAGLYLHVEGDSSDLNVGDQVATGDVIARVGQTGWTCGPHLHFQVQEICGSWWCQSVPAEFQGGGCDPGGISIGGISAPDGGADDTDRDTMGVGSRWGGAGLLALVGLGLMSRRRRR